MFMNQYLDGALLYTYNSNTQYLDQWQNVTVDLSTYDGKDDIQVWFSGTIATSGETNYGGINRFCPR